MPSTTASTEGGNPLTSSSRKRIAGTLAVAVAWTGAFLLFRPRTPQWNEMNAALDGYPSPPGFRIEARSSSGSYLWFDLPNEHPSVGMHLVPEGAIDHDSLCEATTASALDWVRSGRIDHPVQRLDEWCYFVA